MWGFLTGIFGNLVASAVYERLPSLGRFSIRIAVWRLPSALRPRYREEWLSDLFERRGFRQKLSHCFQCLVYAHRLRAVYEKSLITLTMNRKEVGRVDAATAKAFLHEVRRYLTATGGRDHHANEWIEFAYGVVQGGPKCARDVLPDKAKVLTLAKSFQAAIARAPTVQIEARVSPEYQSASL